VENVRISLARGRAARARAPAGWAWRAWSVGLLLALLGLPLGSAGAQGQVTFTLNIKSAFAHTLPDGDTQRAASLFKDQTFLVLGRTADNLWVKLDYSGARTDVWIPVSIGTIGGNLKDVPVMAASQPAVTPPSATPAGTASGVPAQGPPAPASPAVDPGYQPVDEPIIPTLSPTALAIYQRGLAMGNNPRAFSKIGDCQSVVPYFLAAFDYGLYNLGPYSNLQPAIDNFAGSWARDSVTSNRGFNVATVFVPVWADPKRCETNETPLACEFRINRPSIAIITMETWWGGDASGYESYLRGIIEFSIAHGTVPILATKADNIEGNGAINQVIVKLAKEYDVPLWNFWAAVQPLPDHGLINDGFHLTWARNFFDQPAIMQNAWPWRNLSALQAIDAVWRQASGQS
jgi:hypothetical protein